MMLNILDDDDDDDDGDSTVVVPTSLFTPEVTIALTNPNCNSITDVTVEMLQTAGEIDMLAAVISTDGGYFDFASLAVGDIVGSSSVQAAGGNINITATLSVSMIFGNFAIINANNVVDGNYLGAFVFSNTNGGGVNITTSSLTVPDTNTTTAGNYSVALLSGVFVTPNAPFVVFTTTMSSELGDHLIQIDSLALNCGGGLRLAAPSANSLKVYPNPSNGVVNLEVTNSEEKNVSYTLINSLGQVVKLVDYGLTTNISETIDISDKGIYFIQLNVGGEITFKKLIIN